MKGINFEYGYKSLYSERASMIKRAGFDSVLLSYDEFVEDAMLSIRNAGLNIDALHLPYRKMVNNIWLSGDVSEPYLQLLSGCIAYADKMGIRRVVAHITSTDSPPPKNIRGVEFINKLLAVCEKYNVYLCLENLRRLDYLEYIFEECGSRLLGFCFDSGHASAFTHNPTSFPWEKFGEKLTCVHLHDNNGVDDEHLLPFDGSLPWEVIAPKIGHYCKTGAVSLELHDGARARYNGSEEEFLNMAYQRISKIYNLM
ncbi:MAG: sugar phosphate isomerase/epimerase [Clostridia bacterium]|nr:sugar phosphate isomerase/epimerase [Clostridia bacterium]